MVTSSSPAPGQKHKQQNGDAMSSGWWLRSSSMEKNLTTSPWKNGEADHKRYQKETLQPSKLVALVKLRSMSVPSDCKHSKHVPLQELPSWKKKPLQRLVLQCRNVTHQPRTQEPGRQNPWPLLKIWKQRCWPESTVVVLSLKPHARRPHCWLRTKPEIRCRISTQNLRFHYVKVV